ncbi:hypothetical protein GLW08_07395 [Pontibacillus yanchengensis]|uniref:Uncharacterized protein n=2 Tax=Pontibacillus yanchengensis TaxID=462910 RepID=A0A6I5A175_9BACI|nr:hypothetical protein [Pontibacillus yanchengensis]MYL34073.1 hypothetical protein [Pontibacillus yanchengensis]MYL53161.1 hypothetical protein [Pontibacillus yanchengensis]
MKEFRPKWLLLGLIGIGVLILILMTVFGFFISEEKAVKKATSMAKQEFEREDISINHELEDISLYLPERMEILSNEANNLLLQEDEQKYILFYNTFEKPTNDTFYTSAKQADDILHIESFENEERFGYIRVLSIEEDMFELQVGVGGVKMTTETTKRAMEDDARNMMKIVRSIGFKASNE